MTAFIIVMAVLLAMEVAMHTLIVFGHKTPERTPGSYALNAVVNMCLLGWAIGLLAK